MAGPGPAGARLSARVAGSCSRWSVRGSSALALGLHARLVDGARRRPRGRPRSSRCSSFALAAPALALRPQLFGIAIFAGLLWLVATRAATIRAGCGLAPAAGRPVGEHARLVRARAARPRVRVARRRRPRTAVAHRRSPSSSSGSSRRSSTRSDRRCGRMRRGSAPTRRSPSASASGSGPRRSPCRGRCSTRRRSATLIVLVRGRAALRWPDWLWVAGMLAIGAWTVRGLAWWPFAAAFVVAAALPVVLAPRSGAAAARSARPSPIAAILAIVFGLAIVVALPWWRPADPLTGRVGLLTYAPSGLAQAVATPPRPGDRVFTPADVGVVVRVGGAGRPATSSTPGSSCSRPRSGTTTTRSSGWRRAAGGPRPMGRDRRWSLPPGTQPPDGRGCRLPGRRWRRAAPRGRGRPRPAGTFGRPGGPDRLCYGRPTGEVGSMTQGRTATDDATVRARRCSTSSSSAAAATSACRSPRVRRRRPARRHLRHQRARRSSGSAGARCRSSRTAPTSCSASVLATGRLELSTDAEILGRADAVLARDRHARRRVPRPVDARLRAGRRPDRAPPPRRRRSSSCAARSTRARPSTSRRRSRTAACASTSRSAPSGSPRATRSRSSTRCRRSSAPTRPRPATAPRRCSGGSAPRPLRTTSKEAELAKLFTNTWRYMKFAIANQFFVIADQAGVDYTNVLRRDPRGLPARGGPARAPGSPPARACSRTRCSWRPSRPTTSRWARRRCRSTRACPRTSSSALERRHGSLRGRDDRHPRHGVQGRVATTSARRSATSCASCSSRAGAQVLCTDPYVDDDRLRPARGGPRAAARSSSSARRTARTARSTSAAARSSTSGTRPATGSGCSAVKVLVTGAAGFICGYLVAELLARRPRGRRPRQLQQVRPRRRSRTTTHPRYRLVEGDAKDIALLTRARRRRATRSSPARR